MDSDQESGRSRSTSPPTFNHLTQTPRPQQSSSSRPQSASSDLTTFNDTSYTTTQIEGDGAGDKNQIVPLRRRKPGSLQSYLRNRHHVAENEPKGEEIVQSSYFQTEDALKINTSIEIFFGNLTNFGTFCTSLCGKGNTSLLGDGPLEDDDDNEDELADERTATAREEIEDPSNCSIFTFNRPVSVPQIDQSFESFPRYHLGKTRTTSRIIDDEECESVEEEEDVDDQTTVEETENDTSEEYDEPESISFDESKIPRKRQDAFDNRKVDDDREEFEAITNPLNTTVDPCVVKKLCLVGHPLTSFKGLNNFKKLHEAWITNCNISDLRWKDFKSLKLLQRLYLFGGEISTIEPLHFENLRVLWLSNNKLSSLNFLTFGMPQLAELNVANNQITCLEAEDLYKCSSLQNFNVAGNPLCTIQDVENINVVSTVKELYLVDPSYGKCPVSSLCESRSLLVNKLRHVKILNGKTVSDTEREKVQVYISQRCLHYYASSVSCGSSHTAMRKVALQGAFKQLESLGARIADLSTYSAKCLQADYQMTGLPSFAKTKQHLLVDVSKIQTRLSHLKQWTRVILRRIESLLRISRWEQEMDEWIKWVEFKSFGTIQSYISHSASDPEASHDKENIRASLHQLISALSCKTPWPRHTLFKLETIIVIKDKGAEAGMEKIYEDNYSRKNEPKFIPPPPLEEEPTLFTTEFHPLLSCQPFYGPPCTQPFRVVPTYVDPDYKPPPPIFPYPESVAGLPERSQPLLLFLITGRGGNSNDSLQYFHNLLFEKSRYFKDVRLTNCIWTATQLNTVGKSQRDPSHSVLFVVKVLEESLLTVGKCSDEHREDCLIFRVRGPLCYTPAYIVYISHIPNDKKGNWYERVSDDKDVTGTVGKLLDDISNRIMDLGAAPSRKNVPYYLHRTHDGVKADLTAVTKLMLLSTRYSDVLTKPKNGAELLSVTKFLGTKISETITSLDLSANGLGLAVGLEGMISLRKLNISYNNLTTLSGLHKLPQLKELKTGWNSLRFFHSNINTLVWACSKLQVLEILPNPFQDIRDYAHIPVLANNYLPFLKRVDAWTSPFQPPAKCPISDSLELSSIDTNFSKEVLKFTWVGDNVSFMDYSGRCATNLDMLPPIPHHLENSTSPKNGIILSLSDNYITSTCLYTSPIVTNSEWRSFLVKLDLQENAITNLEWMGNKLFPNLRILNVSNNQLSDVDSLAFPCPNLLHLQISGNPIPCNLAVLHPLRCLKELMTLDASRTPLATHPDYASYVLKNMINVQMLDGVGMLDWNTAEEVGSGGGILSQDWLETHIGMRNWANLTEVSLPNCDLHKIEFPCGSLPKLLSLDLTGNCLHTLSGLSSLPKLRVLCVSNNRIKSVCDSCSRCYDKLTDQQPQPCSSSRSQLLQQPPPSRGAGSERRKFPNNHQMLHSISEVFTSSLTHPESLSSNCHHSSFIRSDGGIHYSNAAGWRSKCEISKTSFPNLEVLVLSHNGLTSVEDLHLHSLPCLRTVILNCNKIKGFEGLDNLTTLRALVLDNNHINQIPFSCMMGNNSLKYLHLEHNRLSALPRFPNLRHLSALHIGYNRIQSLTDVSCLGQLELQELTLLGNPSCKSEYWKGIVAELPHLQKLDGVNVLQLKLLQECGKKMTEIGECSDDWEDIDELPPGYIPDCGLRVKPLPTAYHARLRHDGNE